MCPSTSSYRMSTSSSPSRSLRRSLRKQDFGDSVNKTTAGSYDNSDIRSRGHSDEYSASAKSSSVSSSATAPKRLSRELDAKSPVMVFFRTLFIRFLTTRRKRRSRGLATRKMKNNNYQTRDDHGNVQGDANLQSKSFTSIPTDEHEMFTVLHSKSKRSLMQQQQQQLLSNSSSHSQASIRRRHNRTLSSSSTHSHHRPRSARRNADKPPVEVIGPPLLVIEHRNDGQPILLS